MATDPLADVIRLNVDGAHLSCFRIQLGKPNNDPAYDRNKEWVLSNRIEVALRALTAGPGLNLGGVVHGTADVSNGGGVHPKDVSHVRWNRRPNQHRWCAHLTSPEEVLVPAFAWLVGGVH